MVDRTRSARTRIGFADAALDLWIDVAAGGAAGGAASLTGLGVGGGSEPAPATGLPLVDIVIAGAGRSWSGSRYCESVAGSRLRYSRHEEHADGPWRQLRIELEDPVTGVRGEVFYQVLVGHGVLRSWVRLTNGGPKPVTVESVTRSWAGDSRDRPELCASPTLTSCGQTATGSPKDGGSEWRCATRCPP